MLLHIIILFLVIITADPEQCLKVMNMCKSQCDQNSTKFDSDECSKWVSFINSTSVGPLSKLINMTMTDCPGAIRSINCWTCGFACTGGTCFCNNGQCSIFSTAAICCNPGQYASCMCGDFCKASCSCR